MKTCSKCQQPGEFRDGHQQCLDCERRYNREYYARNIEYFVSYRESNRQKYRTQNVEIMRRKRLDRYAEVDRYKSGPCVDCKQSFPPYVMDFDHRPGSPKIGNLSALVKSSSWALILAEIAKCDVVCANCHRIRSWVPSESASPKRLLIRETKGQVCLDCKGVFHYSQLDFDHVRGVKALEVSQASGYGLDFILSEIAKCDVVCANCHRVRTYSKGTTRLQLEEGRMRWSRKRKEGVQKDFAPSPPSRPTTFRPWHQLAGTVLDVDLARRFSISPASVCTYRKKAGIPVFRSARVS